MKFFYYCIAIASDASTVNVFLYFFIINYLEVVCEHETWFLRCPKVKKNHFLSINTAKRNQLMCMMLLILAGLDEHNVTRVLDENNVAFKGCSDYLEEE